jgi:hypothetical protein
MRCQRKECLDQNRNHHAIQHWFLVIERLQQVDKFVRRFKTANGEAVGEKWLGQVQPVEWGLAMLSPDRISGSECEWKQRVGQFLSYLKPSALSSTATPEVALGKRKHIQ